MAILVGSVLIRKDIHSWIRKSARLAIMGIGNSVRGDDAVGVKIVELLQMKVPNWVKLFDCEEVPENFLTEVEKFKPTHVLMIDAADLGYAPGEAVLLEPERIAGLTISTHSIPLSILAKAIQNMCGAQVMVLGIQPGRMDFEEGLTPELIDASKRLSNMIQGIFIES